MKLYMSSITDTNLTPRFHVCSLHKAWNAYWMHPSLTQITKDRVLVICTVFPSEHCSGAGEEWRMSGSSRNIAGEGEQW